MREDRRRATTAPSTGNTRATAVFLGDSNEVLSGTDLAVSLLNRDNGYIVVEVARPGATIRFRRLHTTHNVYYLRRHRQSQPVVDTLAAVQPDVWVVDLGINDANRPGTPTSPGYSNYGAKYQLADETCSDQHRSSGQTCRARSEHKRPENRMQADQSGACRCAGTRRPNLSVLNWASKANPHPEYLGPPYSVHLTTAGQSAWTGLVTERLDSMFTAPWPAVNVSTTTSTP